MGEQRMRPLPVSWIALLAALPGGCDVDGYVGSWTRSAAPPLAAAGGAAGVNQGRDAVGLLDAAVHDDASNARSGNPSTVGSAGAAAPVLPDACHRAREGAATPLDVTVVDTNAVIYDFADGATFPAGQYRLEYVDGCRRYDDTAAWTLHASTLASALSAAGRGGCFLVMSNRETIAIAPGTAGVVVGEGGEPLGAYASYDECVAANLKLAPITFNTTQAGPIGVMNAGDSSTAKSPGEAVGGRSPSYRLTRLDPCP